MIGSMVQDRRPRRLSIQCGSWAVAVSALLSCDHGIIRTGPAAAVEGGDAHSEQASRVVWEAPLELVTGPARVGPWRMNESEFHYVDDPSVAFADDGRVAVVWADNRRQNVYFRLHDPEGRPLHDPIDVSRSPDIFSWLPRVLITDEDDVFVLWQEIVFSGGSHGGEIFFARSQDGGASFEEPVNLSNTPAGAGKGRLTRERWSNGSLDLARTPAGELLVAWTEYEGPLRFSRSDDAGRTFSPPVHVTGDPTVPARGPSIAVGANGAVHLAWTVGETSQADLRIARSEDGGASFARPLVIRSPGHADTPQVGVDGAGVVHVVHTERATRGRGQPRVRHARSARGEPFESREIPTIAGAGGASSPSLGFDGEDRLYVIWEHHRGAGRHARGLGFTWSNDGGRTFASPSTIPETTDPRLGVNGSRQGDLMRKLAVHESGELAVVNSSFLENEASRVRLIRGRWSTVAACGEAFSARRQ